MTIPKIKVGDTGIRINVTHTASATVYYSINGGSEVALTDNNHLILSVSDTARRGENHIVFIEKDTDLRVTCTDETVFDYVVY